MTDPASYVSHLHISWEDMHRDAQELAKRLQSKSWKGIIAVTRGGLIPAGILSRSLNIRLIETLCISSYDFQDQGALNVLKKPEGIGDGAGWLVIDDLVDTGKTFIAARKLFPSAHYACIYAKPKGAGTADSFVTEVSQETWIHFPWEVEEN